MYVYTRASSPAWLELEELLGPLRLCVYIQVQLHVRAAPDARIRY